MHQMRSMLVPGTDTYIQLPLSMACMAVIISHRTLARLRVNSSRINPGRARGIMDKERIIRNTNNKSEKVLLAGRFS
jgi:hypothetical protein